MKIALFLSAAVVVGVAAPALAGPVKQTRSTFYEGTPVTLTSVALVGFPPFEFVQVGAGNVAKTLLTGCFGYVRVDPFGLPAQPTALKVRGNSYSLAAAPSYRYKCASVEGELKLVNENGTWVTDRPNFFLSELDGRYYIKAESGEKVKVPVIFEGVPDDRSIRADACGMVTVRDSSARPWSASTEIKVGSNTYTVGSIATGALPRCVRVGEQYKLFTN